MSGIGMGLGIEVFEWYLYQRLTKLLEGEDALMYVLILGLIWYC
jgi:hypothetical protein